MAARKLQQEVDKCFKKVSEGVAEFESIYEKIEQSTNAAQKEKLEDNLKREIKKLQRLRDQIKTWAASNDIKDKGPLLEHRRLIETVKDSKADTEECPIANADTQQMEKFKAVEKAMKTKAYSKEGLSAAARLDPKERAKLEACDFLSSMVEELERQTETLEAEGESIQATMKKGKHQSTKADRVAEIERITERHKWHQGKLELIKRSLENGGVETDQVTDLEETIKYYVSDGMNDDFMEDDEMYDDLNLQEEEDNYGMNMDNDRVSSQDTQSVQDEAPESEGRSNSIPGGGKVKPASDAPPTAARRPSIQLKSPLPALATLHTPLTSTTNGSAAASMKPASLPARAPGETLKYASAAAAAAAATTSNVGIAPLPPPPGAASTANAIPGGAPLPTANIAKLTPGTSPIVTHAQPTASGSLPPPKSTAPPPGPSEAVPPAVQTKSPAQNPASTSQTVAAEKSIESVKPRSSRLSAAKPSQVPPETPEVPAQATSHTNGNSNGVSESVSATEPEESVYHLPSGLQDLLQSFEATQRRNTSTTSQSVQRMLAASHGTCPTATDSEQPRSYKPKYRWNTPSHYPKDPLPIFDDPALYSRIDPDTLFYIFYYRQGTYQQYLAAKSLKDQSWRFHKQYQTWFQRHEEPKTITEEFEQGTYRFFDYESTWMNRRKAEFKFAYKFLEDDV